MLAGIASMGSKSSFVLEKKTVLEIDLTGVINDRVEENPFDFLFGEVKAHGLNDILSAIKKAKKNDKIEGIYLKAGFLRTGPASAQQIRNELRSFKESGKFIVAYGDNYSQRAYYVSSVADKVFMNPEGIFEFQGMSSSIQFAKGLFEKLGIEWQVFKVGTFKSAVEPIISDKMSEPNRLQRSAYLNDIWSVMLKDISESRNIPVEKLNQYADECMTFASSEVIRTNQLIDSLVYRADMESYFKEKLNLTKDDDLKIADVNDIKSVPASKEKLNKDKIAVLYAEGEIIADELNTIFNTGHTITAKKYVKEINKLKEDENIKAVVFRVNSPGGSAFASEQIHHAIKALNEVKPVVVSMGDYAASGGYYISSPARKIVAEPTTLTGSIGIFGLIPSGVQLSEKIGTTYDHVKTNKMSDFLGQTIELPLVSGVLARPLNTDESAIFQAFVERGYNTFLTRCAEGRGKTKAEIDSIGQGRVWTGNQALSNGLVDELGGIDKAIQIAAGLAEIENYSIREYPEQKDFFTQLMEESMKGAETRILSVFIGEEALKQKQMMKAWQTFDVKQAVTPVVIH
ncbi:signal peptide peptidase SppA [Bacteroidia bacterium]|nr:signal peptide peptidase SppA [Bacteroidia bacterium]